MSSRTTATSRIARRRTGTGRGRLLTVLATTCAALLGWLVVGPLAGVDLAVQPGRPGAVEQVGPLAVATVGLLTGLAGWALLSGLERFTVKARPIWTAIAGLGLTLSLLGPLAGVTASAQAALACLHLLVGAVLIIGLRRTAPRS